MERNSGLVKREDQMELPPGFRFHPTDEELITHYLSKKVADSSFSAVAIGDVDMNKIEPWDLPWKAKLGEKEWYFFCVRDRKYPTGLRTNRATATGYWKATGKDKDIFRGKTLVGMKKTLVFYRGRAPKGEKSNWVCHEYRPEGHFTPGNLPRSSRTDWVISRVFHKTPGGKKVPLSGLMKMDSSGPELAASAALPPLMDPSAPPPAGELGSGHVHCFSNAGLADRKIQEEFIANPLDPFLSSPGFPWWPELPFSGLGHLHDNSILRAFLASCGQEMKDGVSVSQETTENSSVVSNAEVGKKAFGEHEGPQDLDCIWTY